MEQFIKPFSVKNKMWKAIKNVIALKDHHNPSIYDNIRDKHNIA